MFYSKPKDVTYTGMAIFIDNHPLFDIKDDAQLENQIFEYLYHLSYMLAAKDRYFNSARDYDGFAIYLATKMFFRLKKPGVKSVLNYLKAIINFKRIEYQQQNYSQIIEKPNEENVISQYTFASKISDGVNRLDATDFKVSLYDLPKSIKSFLKRVPYEENSIVWNNIYLSCLLTFLDQITLTNYDLKRVTTDRNSPYLERSKYQCLDKEQSNTKAILYHLDDNMNNYIIVLVREMKQYIANELSYICHDNICYTDLNQAIMNDLNSMDSSELYD